MQSSSSSGSSSSSVVRLTKHFAEGSAHSTRTAAGDEEVDTIKQHATALAVTLHSPPPPVQRPPPQHQLQHSSARKRPSFPRVCRFVGLNERAAMSSPHPDSPSGTLPVLSAASESDVVPATDLVTRDAAGEVSTSATASSASGEYARIREKHKKQQVSASTSTRLEALCCQCLTVLCILWPT